MQLQPFTKEDIASLSELQPQGWGDLAPVFEFYTSSSFCFPIKIIIDNHIAGIGSSIIHNDVAWLAHIIVHTAYRNKGIGRFITQSLIDRIDKVQCQTIYLIATDLGAPVYEKLGFVTETEYLFYKDIKPNKDTVASSLIIPYNSAYKAPIQKIDAIVSGEDRLFHLEPYLATAFLYVKENTLEGYYLPDFGDGFIAARTPEAGSALMMLRFTAKEHAVFPIDNTSAKEYMLQHQYEPFKTAKRMRLGTERKVDFSKIYNRISGSMG